MSANQPLTALTAPEVCPTRLGWRARETAFAGRLAAYLLPVAAGIIYLLFPTQNYYWDGISFAFTIENSKGLSASLIHPHHLLYNVFGYLLYSLTQSLGLQIRAVELLQISNSILSVLCAGLLLRFLKRTMPSQTLATAMVAAFSFSATWWKYSTDADAYIPSVLFLLVCLNLLLAVERLRPLLLALVHTASMCIHQLAVFFFPVILVGMLLRDEYSLKERIRLALRYTAGTSLTTLSINYYCFHWQTGGFGLGTFFRWLTSYVQGPDSYSFSFDILSNLGYTLRGQVRLFFEGRINWTKGLLSLPVILLIALLVSLAATLAFRFVGALPKFRPRFLYFKLMDDRFRPIVIVCIVWAVSYLLFLFFWYPYFTPYRLFYLAPLIILGGVFLAQRARNARTLSGVAMFVTAMAISNFVFFILPLSHAEKFPPLSFALKMNRTWSPKSVVYYAESNADNQLVRYFNPNTSWRTLKSDQEDSLEKGLVEVYQADGTVWLETSGISQMESSANGKSWLAAHSIANCGKELKDGSYRMRFVQLFPISSAARLRSNCVADGLRE